MLQTVREFAREQLRLRGQADEVCARHAAYYLDPAETAEKELRGRQRVHWSGRLEGAQADCSAAVRWFHARGELADGRRPVHVTRRLGFEDVSVAGRTG